MFVRFIAENADCEGWWSAVGSRADLQSAERAQLPDHPVDLLQHPLPPRGIGTRKAEGSYHRRTGTTTGVYRDLQGPAGAQPVPLRVSRLMVNLRFPLAWGSPPRCNRSARPLATSIPPAPLRTWVTDLSVCLPGPDGCGWWVGV